MHHARRRAILIRHYQSAADYRRLGNELRRLLDDDPTFPTDAVYVVKQRYKSEERLIEKIDQESEKLVEGTPAIDATNFRDHIDDILGLRIVYLRLSQRETLTNYMSNLITEGLLKEIRPPIRKLTFRTGLLDSDEADDAPSLDLQYSGYASTHYLVALGAEAANKLGLDRLKAEIQLRTIFEEAWGEVDHKYRYELVRRGVTVERHIDTGFRDLSRYLWAAAEHAEHLCEDIDLAGQEVRADVATKQAPRTAQPRVQPVSIVGADVSATATAVQPGSRETPPEVGDVIRQRLGFLPSDRLLAYFRSRFAQHSYHTGRIWDGQVLGEKLSDEMIARYREIFHAEIGRYPFLLPIEQDLDILPLVNFALFSEVDSQRVAEAGLRSALQRRPR